MRLFLSVFFVLILPMLGLAHQPDGAQCAKKSDDDERLLCYDLVFKKTIETKEKTKGTGKWLVEVETSKIDDSQNVYAFLYSTDTFQERYKKPAHVSLQLRCKENTTAVIFTFGGAFMSDHDGNGRVTLRIDKQTAFNRNLGVSTSNRALGLWRGSTAIPFIKGLLDRESLLLRFTPYNESVYTVTFPISGLREAIRPLAEACDWKV